MNALPEGFTEWWQTLKRSSFAWLNLIGQDGPVPQLCQAWAVFDGTVANGAVTPADSFNITSITKNGTGDYTVVVTIPFATVNYAVLISCNNSVAAAYGFMNTATAKSTTTVRFNLRGTAAGADVNSADVTVAMFGRQ